MNYYIKTHKTTFQFSLGLVIFLFFNTLTALTLGAHYDEAYYWMYSKFPAFGYFDHPPMVSWMINAGEFFFNHLLALRFVTLVISTASIVLIWRIVRKYDENPLLFWAIIYSILLIHPYSFITTPDAPLFFFTILFFTAYKSFDKHPSLINAIAVSLFAAFMFYSKYHAFLVVGFTLLSNIKLLRNKYFWLCIFFLFLALVPHLWWQYNNDFVSFRYHLVDSHKTAYEPKLTLEYLITQLVVTGPLSGWLLLWFLFKDKCDNTLEKGLKFAGIGIYVFFFFTTFMGDFEAHWTLAAIVPLIIIGYKNLLINKKFIRLIIISGSINFGLLLLTRILILTPMAENISALRFFNGWENDAKIMKEATLGYPVLYQDNWNKVARYAWYTNKSEVGALNSGLHRKNQFDLWNTDEWYSGQSVFVISTDSLQFTEPLIVKTPKAVWYVKRFDNFRSYYDLSFELVDFRIANDTLLFSTIINNPYSYPIEIDDGNVCFELYQRGNKWMLLAASDTFSLNIAPYQSIIVETQIEPIPFEQENIYLMLKIGELNPIPVRQPLK